ncbi:hypothetical protein [Paenibacillus sp. MMO-177]|uniref:hypothetical protein n=1 Tax=Paenibacillus sp. MMO-177 TaxID=3081289 RepID=UPI003015FA43
MTNQIRVPMLIEDKEIDYIVSTAFEGGINYWCRKAEVVEPTGWGNEDTPELLKGTQYEGAEYASDLISRGGRILLHEHEGEHNDEPEKYTLTKEKVLAGIQLFMEKAASDPNHIKLDLDNYDANDADLIVQYGIFGEIVFS